MNTQTDKEIIDSLPKDSYLYEGPSDPILTCPIVTVIESLNKFYPAENYHQDYYENNKENSYCKFVIQPKLEKFKKVFYEKIEKRNN